LISERLSPIENVDHPQIELRIGEPTPRDTVGNPLSLRLVDNLSWFVNQFELTSGTPGYDPGNTTLLGRGVSLQVVMRWGL
jgi:hypothetical protein